MLGSPNSLPTSTLFVVLCVLFSDPDWYHLIALLFDSPLLPATAPSTLSHAPQLPAPVISPFSDPSSTSGLLHLHSPFPTKTSSNAKINCLHQHPPQSSPLAGDVKAFSSLIQGWRNSTFSCFAFFSFHCTFLFPPGIVQGSICKQRCHSWYRCWKRADFGIYFLPMKCQTCLNCCPLPSVLSLVMESWQFGTSLFALPRNHCTRSFWRFSLVLEYHFTVLNTLAPY